MVVVEYGNQDYGKIMKYIACIEEKAQCVKEILEKDTAMERKHRRYDDEEEEYDKYNMRGGRYM